jgi:pimeloyl-ACP methyl ester carboxylesterase
MSNDFSNDPGIEKSLLQQTALSLQNQFRDVVFEQDRRVHHIRFEIRESPASSETSHGAPSLEIFGRLEFEGDLEDALETIRRSYPLEILKISSSASEPNIIQANISPLAQGPGWNALRNMPAVFKLEILLLEPSVTIQFPAADLAPGDAQSRSEVIFLIHGIRDRARWQSLVKRIMEEIDGVEVIPIRYGYFDVFRFWLPVCTRSKPIRYTQKQIQIGKNNYRVNKYSVIAHSFGTYAISKVLDDTQDLALERLVLCGCIIPKSYPWEHLKGRIKHKVINDYGTRDIWPFWARKLSWGYGETGRYGFGRSDVEDRAHNHGHSDYFDESFIRAYWKPLFESGQVVKSTWEEKAPKPSRILEIISMLPVKSLLAVFSTALAIAVYQLVQWLVSSAN